MIGRKFEAFRFFSYRGSLISEGQELIVHNVRLEASGVAGRVVEISSILDQTPEINHGYKPYDLGQYSELLVALGDGNVWWLPTCLIARNCLLLRGS